MARKYPQQKIDQLSWQDRTTAAGYLIRKDEMQQNVAATREVKSLAQAVSAPQVGPAVSSRGDRMVVGGVVIRRRANGDAAVEGVDAPEKPAPQLF